MPAYAVKQPNGLYARFSTVVDGFTHINHTRTELWFVFRDECGTECADGKMERAETELQRFEDAIQTISGINGKSEGNKARKECSKSLTIAEPLSEKEKMILLMMLAGVDFNTVEWDEAQKTFVKK